MRPRRALQVSYWKVAALMAFGAFPSGPLQLSRRNATFFKVLGGGCSCIRVLGEQFPPARGVSDSPIYSFGRTIPPDLGGKRFPKFEVLMKQSIPAAKTPILQPYKRKTRGLATAAYQPPHVFQVPPLVSNFGVPSCDGSFGDPRVRGLCPSGGACSPWGPVPPFWVLVWTLKLFGRLALDPPLTPVSDPEGRQVPCLGVCLFSTTKGPGTALTGSTLQVAHPGRGAPSVWGWLLCVVGRVYGSFVAVSVLARGRPAGGALRAEETASLAIGSRHGLLRGSGGARFSDVWSLAAGLSYLGSPVVSAQVQVCRLHYPPPGRSPAGPRTLFSPPPPWLSWLPSAPRPLAL